MNKLGAIELFTRFFSDRPLNRTVQDTLSSGFMWIYVDL